MMDRTKGSAGPGAMPRTASNRLASQVNRAVLLDALRGHGALSRADLSRRTGLSVATVNRLVDRLIDDGEVTESGQAASSRGRPARLVQFNAAARSVLAVDIGGRRIRAAVADLHARVVARREVPISASGRGAGRDVFESLSELVQEMLGEAQGMGADVDTVCVGVPGVIRGRTGRVEFAPALQWFDFPLVELLEDRLKLKVLAENDVNLAALAESRHGSARGRTDILAISIGTGVGAALILGGELYRGASGGAGEVGYTMLDRRSLASPWPGFGDLESRVGTAGVLRRLGGPAGEQGTESFLDAVRAGSATELAVFDELVDDLALAIANSSVLINPDAVVLGGGLGRAAADLLIPAIHRRLTGRIPFEPTLLKAELDDAELIGAAEVAIDASAASAAHIE